MSFRRANQLIAAVASSLWTAAALAQDAAPAAAPKGPSTLEMLVMPVGFILIMYFFIIRPQQKKAREHTDLLAALKPGDEVVTTGGIIGRVKSVAETFVTLDVGGNTSLKVLKTAVNQMTKPPAAQAAGKEAPAKQ